MHNYYQPLAPLSPRGTQALDKHVAHSSQTDRKTQHHPHCGCSPVNFCKSQVWTLSALLGGMSMLCPHTLVSTVVLSVRHGAGWGQQCSLRSSFLTAFWSNAALLQLSFWLAQWLPSKPGLLICYFLTYTQSHVTVGSLACTDCCKLPTFNSSNLRPHQMWVTVIEGVKEWGQKNEIVWCFFDFAISWLWTGFTLQNRCICIRNNLSTLIFTMSSFYLVIEKIMVVKSLRMHTQWFHKTAEALCSTNGSFVRHIAIIYHCHFLLFCQPSPALVKHCVTCSSPSQHSWFPGIPH